MDQKKRDDYQDELDVFQTAWVLGRQKGEKLPLKKDQYEALLKAGRIEWEWLSEEEKKVVGDRLKLQDDQDREMMTRERKITIAQRVVKSLVSLIRKDFLETVSLEDWEKMTAQNKLALTEQLFKIKYGSFPDFFVWDVYRTMGGWNG